MQNRVTSASISLSLQIYPASISLTGECSIYSSAVHNDTKEFDKLGTQDHDVMSVKDTMSDQIPAVLSLGEFEKNVDEFSSVTRAPIQE
jgi:hypothetical protein